jgi:hypothetical protein
VNSKTALAELRAADLSDIDLVAITYRWGVLR